jgi:hypothetical protein
MDKRRKIYVLPASKALYVFGRRSGITNIPKNSQLVTVYYEHMADSFHLIVECEDFPPVPEGVLYERVICEVEIVKRRDTK